MEDPGRNAGGTLGEYSYTSRAAAAGEISRERSAGDLLKEIVGNVQEIIRSEVRLAKVEVREEASKGIGAAKFFAIGGLLGLYALGFVLLSLVYLLSTVVPSWAAALIVGLATGGAAAFLMIKGRDRMKHVSPKPEKTIENVKENVAWIKDQTKS